MNRIKTTIGLAVMLLASVFANAQDKGASLLMRPNPAVCSETRQNPAPSNVHGKCQIFQSHIKSLGTIGRTSRYEVIAVKIRGLDTPNVAGFLVYDAVEDTLSNPQTAGSPGLGVAIVNGGSYVAGSYLFGSKLRPNGGDNVTVNSNATGGNGNATGGAGGSGTGGNGTGGNGTGGNGNGGSGNGHPDSPGNGGIPGNGGQNGGNPHNN